jgi:hypothetical protein
MISREVKGGFIKEDMAQKLYHTLRTRVLVDGKPVSGYVKWMNGKMRA